MQCSQEFLSMPIRYRLSTLFLYNAGINEVKGCGMTVFQMILLAATAFFAYRIFEHVQGLEDPKQDDAQANNKIKYSPFDPDILVEQADDAYKRGDLNHAARLLREAKSKEPNNPEILNRYAFVLAKKGEVEEAIEHYERSLKMDPNDDLAHNAIATLLRETNRLYEAQEHLKAALDIDDNYEETYFNYGNLLVSMNDLEGAKMMYEKALEIKPDFKEATIELEKLQESV